MLEASAGRIHNDEIFYDLDATTRDGRPWTAARILLGCQWDSTDLTVIAQGQMRSMTAHLDFTPKKALSPPALLRRIRRPASPYERGREARQSLSYA